VELQSTLLESFSFSALLLDLIKLASGGITDECLGARHTLFELCNLSLCFRFVNRDRKSETLLATGRGTSQAFSQSERKWQLARS
jgi:hypothetical protein